MPTAFKRAWFLTDVCKKSSVRLKAFLFLWQQHIFDILKPRSTYSAAILVLGVVVFQGLESYFHISTVQSIGMRVPYCDDSALFILILKLGKWR